MVSLAPEDGVWRTADKPHWEAITRPRISRNYLSLQRSDPALAVRRVNKVKPKCVLWFGSLADDSWTVDLIRSGQMKARVGNHTTVFTGEETKISDMLISHSSGQGPRPGNTSKATPSLLRLSPSPCSSSDGCSSCTSHSQSNNEAIMLPGEEKQSNYLPGQVPGVSFLVRNYSVVKRLRLCFSNLFSFLCFLFRHWLPGCQTLAPSPGINPGQVAFFRTWLLLSFTFSQPGVSSYYHYILTGVLINKASSATVRVRASERGAIPKFLAEEPNPSCFPQCWAWVEWQRSERPLIGMNGVRTGSLGGKWGQGWGLWSSEHPI